MALVPAGVALSLIGLLGDLVSHTLSPDSHAHEELIILGRGNNPWHLVLFAGILLTAIGGVRWTARLGTDLGSLAGAGMILLLVATVGLGTWSGWRARLELRQTSIQHPVQALGDSPVAGASGTAAHAAHDGGTTSAAVVGDGAEGASQFGGHSHGQPGPVSDREGLILAQELAAAKAATASFADISAAKAAGYIQVTQFVPGLGLHLANLGIPDTAFDPARPQLLLYEPNGSGGYTLVGVGYMFRHGSEDPPVGFAGGADVWHYHTDLCFLPGGLVTITQSGAECRSRNGVFQKQTDWLLHAWVWKANPDGVFTESNPTVS
jgi:hypothetical protein